MQMRALKSGQGACAGRAPRPNAIVPAERLIHSWYFLNCVRHRLICLGQDFLRWRSICQETPCPQTIPKVYDSARPTCCRDSSCQTTNVSEWCLFPLIQMQEGWAAPARVYCRSLTNTNGKLNAFSAPFFFFFSSPSSSKESGASSFFFSTSKVTWTCTAICGKFKSCFFPALVFFPSWNFAPLLCRGAKD